LCTNGTGGAGEYLWSPFLTESAESFASSLRMHEGMRMVPVRHGKDFRASTILPRWREIMGLT
jgi:hypothetical protein